ncbi:hypothetical protein AWB75_06127 [Caballeronia catudaia]|uniref:Uncharacterized protein n=1 Tax=Caballeronia catudaia TaxID=1777136 RepID=A0A158D3M8_9BURK|nr:hypothetical protein AWB75_06127 [Caballeronia catudaia]
MEPSRPNVTPPRKVEWSPEPAKREARSAGMGGGAFRVAGLGGRGRRAECHAVVNPAHPDAARLAVSAPQLVVWDQVVHGGRGAPP